MKDQKSHWNNAHKEQWLRSHSSTQTKYAEEVNAVIKSNSKILELGCGEGNDSIYFATQGHSVVATDFSDIVISQNSEKYTHSNLDFMELDISQPFRFEDETFDVVYARLSLHYFTNEQTSSIFREIRRVLKNGGTLHFMCKSVDDSIYGKGAMIEADMYELDGHIRHFFSKDYVRKLLLDNGYGNIEIVSGVEKIYERISAFIKASASKA